MCAQKDPGFDLGVLCDFRVKPIRISDRENENEEENENDFKPSEGKDLIPRWNR